ncbi:MAG TPA: cytochrome c3 family protein [Gemmatimonadaceae bacterium]|nr:cytochrome c3 family protein [Gemmatimonadaceae bacterium]
MTAVRRRIVRGLAAAWAATAFVAWTAGGQQPVPRPPAAAPPSSTTGLDCTSCHRGVHATMTDTGQAASGRCVTCHASAHDAVRTLYTGHGAADQALRPDRMFLARVGCRACHTDAALATTATAPRMTAIEQACTSCHGPNYRNMLARWTEALDRRSRATAAYVAAARGDRRLADAVGARARLQSADADLTLVRTGAGLHNVPGADALFRSAIGKVGAAYRGAGVPVPPPPALGPDPATVSCASCHYGIEADSATPFGQTFRHADHVLSADVACTNCHSAAGYFAAVGGKRDPAHGKTTVTAAGCSACHHAASAAACTTCHTPQTMAGRADSVTLPLHLRPAGAPASRVVAFRHGAHAAVACTSCHASRAAVSTVAACTACHESHHRDAADCVTCHGAGLLASHKAADHLVCAECHARETLALLTGDRTFCLSCHTDRRLHQPARECAPCHLQMSPAEVQAAILGRKP